MLQVKLLNCFAKPPTKGSKDSAGYDIYSSEEGKIHPGRQVLIKTGISMKMPKNENQNEVWCAKIISRSGLSVKSGIEVGAGLIDSDYRGEIGVVLRNFSQKSFTYNIGDRIAQFVLISVGHYPVSVVLDLDDTKRGSGGFGSTGV